MKTSNKLLIAIMLLALVSPLVIMFSFKKAIKEKKYTYTLNSNTDRKPVGIAPYKFVKIVADAPADLLTCTLVPAAKAQYLIEDGYTTDSSLSIQNAGDTLVVAYKLRKNSNYQYGYYDRRNILLCLNSMKHITATGANIIIDSIDTASNPQVAITLLAHASLALGKEGAMHLYRSKIALMQPGEAYPAMPETDIKKEPAPIAVGAVTVHATDANVVLGRHTAINKLVLYLNGSSRLLAEEAPPINTITGAIMPSATIQAPATMLRYIAPLIEK